MRPKYMMSQFLAAMAAEKSRIRDHILNCFDLVFKVPEADSTPRCLEGSQGSSSACMSGGYVIYEDCKLHDQISCATQLSSLLLVSLVQVSKSCKSSNISPFSLIDQSGLKGNPDCSRGLVMEDCDASAAAAALGSRQNSGTPTIILAWVSSLERLQFRRNCASSHSHAQATHLGTHFA